MPIEVALDVATGVLALALGGFFLWLPGGDTLHAVGWDALSQGRPQRALSIARILGQWPGRRFRMATLELQAFALADLGEPERSVPSAERLLHEASEIVDSCPWRQLNCVIDTYVNAGVYREALAALDGWSVPARRRGADADPFCYSLAQINTAEALSNLGRYPEALALLDDVRNGEPLDPLATWGAGESYAWICAASGAPKALVALPRVEDIPKQAVRYLPEAHLTRAFTALRLGKPLVALEFARSALQAATRPSSVRNAHLMLGETFLSLEQPSAAVEHFESAASWSRVRQGGPRLLRYAGFLETAGQHERASQIRTLATELDPQGSAGVG